MLALVHSINCLPLFGLGQFVQGVALNTAASVQQYQLSQIHPGSRLPDPTTPFIALKHGRAVLASSTIGAGLHEIGIQNALNILLYNMTVDSGVLIPNFLAPAFNLSFDPLLHLIYPVDQAFLNGTFSSIILQNVEALGQGVEQLTFSNPQLPYATGYWVGVTMINSSSRYSQRGAATPLLNGYSEGVKSIIYANNTDIY